jgi:tetratricopeptide (TPR) repeat protein
LISGPPGIGKSSLIRRFATSLQARAWPVFIVSCQEIGQGIPYAAIAELITALARDPAAGGTDPLWLAEASRVAPGLRAIYPGVRDAPDAPSDSIRLRVAEAARHMIAAVADNGPVLLAFDDLQFVDPASQEVLFLVARALAGASVSALLLAGTRGGEGGGGLVWGTTVVLQPLEQSHALSLLRDLAADAQDTNPEIHETIVRLSQGNPYHIEMLLADWRAHHANSLVAAADSGDATAVSWTPPDDLRSAFARQYGGLSRDAQHVLQVLAVAGKAIAPVEVASLLGLDGGVSERVVLEMLDRGVGRVEEGKLSFKNELHRTYVYHAMGNDRRTYHHAQLAQRLADSAERRELQVMLELVHHSIGAGLERQAMETGLEAGEAAIARGAPQEAERLLSRLLRAYTVAPGSRLPLLLAHALVALGQYQRALDVLADWRGEAASPMDRALAALLRADALHRARLSGNEATMAAAREAIALARQAHAMPFLVRANYIRMEIGVDEADLATRADAEALAAEVAASDTTPECVALANVTLGQSALQSGELAQGVERLTTAIPILESVGLVAELRRAQGLLGLCYRGLGRVADAVSALQETVALAERTGETGPILHSRLILANLYHDLAWFGAAVDCFREILGPLETMSSPRAVAEANCDLARLAIVLGDMTEAELAVKRCEEGARRSGLWRHHVTACLARADLHLCNGEPDLAWSVLEDAARVTGDRAHLLPEAGRYARLQHQWSWATRRNPAGPAASLSLIDGLEVRLFDEAVAAPPRAAVLEEVVTMGLLGPLARLVASGVRHPAVPQRLSGESAAQLIARVYPHTQRTAIPAAIGLVADRTKSPNR